MDDYDDYRARKPNASNTRDKLMPYKSIPNENIPRKLLIELASLSTLKFKVEAKSKSQSVVLPIALHNRGGLGLQQIQTSIKLENSNDNTDQALPKSVDVAKSRENDDGSSKTTMSLENYYVTLKCTIVNKSLALVPPIRIFIPYNYPESNPLVDCIQLDEFDDDMLPEYSKLN